MAASAARLARRHAPCAGRPPPAELAACSRSAVAMPCCVKYAVAGVLRPGSAAKRRAPRASGRRRNPGWPGRIGRRGVLLVPRLPVGWPLAHPRARDHDPLPPLGSQLPFLLRFCCLRPCRQFGQLALAARLIHWSRLRSCLGPASIPLLASPPPLPRRLAASRLNRSVQAIQLPLSLGLFMTNPGASMGRIEVQNSLPLALGLRPVARRGRRLRSTHKAVDLSSTAQLRFGHRRYVEDASI